ncbi:DUF3800 domain-containing protein [Octadecabacter sp. G9-8]|uniref:DUF3800 domain-containing protein n=1 Tax=Octadecabacter dasysiphoniae TaxID=2909341 RepID=A0ABS9CYY8_9RHOB|nr:DUF3800 domain-containing protein [Octadecabacter dasysiphoniae]MCF2872495.1 DUF3800 domain-containing protein [Octadecabacter dasysiphoniae]
MGTHFTLFIDESGDQDLDKFRTDERSHGSDPFLVFGAALVPTELLPAIRSELDSLAEKLKCDPLHCKEMSHLKTAYFARQASQLRIQLFGVVSKKATVGDYKSDIEGRKQAEDYYNKCASYLLERVGDFMKEHEYGPDQLSVIFEEKKHDYQRLRNFIHTIRKRPIDERANSMAKIDPLAIRAVKKGDDQALALADLTAFSLYQSVNESHSNFGHPEFRYMRELRSKFWKCSKTGKIANFGLKYISGPIKMALKGDTLDFALKMYEKKK